MIALAAANLGYRCHVYAPEADSIAADVCAAFTCAGWYDADALAKFASSCAVVTYEFENVPVAPLAALGVTALHPGTRSLEVAQDRAAEKSFVEGLGGQPAPWAAVESAEDLAAAIARIGTPGILKTRRDGYDGKGQWRIMTPADAAGLELPEVPLVYEGFVTFEAEFSVILVRGADGDVRFWDSAQNAHKAGILSQSVVPAGEAVRAQVGAARALAKQVADAVVALAGMEESVVPQELVLRAIRDRDFSQT
jgi:5-(carboxyamino)imidazole ribonucleotide synthase